MSQGKSSKGKLVVVAIVFAILAMSSLACGGSDDVAAKPDVPVFSTPTQEEVDACWEEISAREKIREEATSRKKVVGDWQGDWDPNARLAIFHGLGHVEDIKVGQELLNLVKVDQYTIKEYNGEHWNVVANVKNNLQPGDKIILNR